MVWSTADLMAIEITMVISMAMKSAWQSADLSIRRCSGLLVCSNLQSSCGGRACGCCTGASCELLYAMLEFCTLLLAVLRWVAVGYLHYEWLLRQVSDIAGIVCFVLRHGQLEFSLSVFCGDWRWLLFHICTQLGPGVLQSHSKFNLGVLEVLSMSIVEHISLCRRMFCQLFCFKGVVRPFSCKGEAVCRQCVLYGSAK